MLAGSFIDWGPLYQKTFTAVIGKKKTTEKVALQEYCFKDDSKYKIIQLFTGQI